jgi:putative SOS response-associated peptidase YedK
VQVGGLANDGQAQSAAIGCIRENDTVARLGGEELTNGKTKQWVITPNDGQPIAIAVIFEEWRNGPEALLTFVMVTTPPNALIARITDRMPAIVPRETWATWLGETDASLEDVKALLRTFEDGGNWMMTPQQERHRSRMPQKTKAQGELF